MGTTGAVTVRLKHRVEVAERTMAFHFEKPPGWSFKAGQYVDVTLFDPPETDSRGNVRAFSIASAPQEETLMIATRMRGTAFKRVLGAMRPGTAVEIDGPFGNLTLHNDESRPAVLLAGGIGITPFRSILVRVAKERRPRRIVLFFSNRRPEDAPFLEELRDLSRENPNCTVVATMTGMSKSRRPWDGERGLIDREKLARHLPDMKGPVYYLAGPPAMVAGLYDLLGECGVDDDDIRSEEFSGY